MDISHFFDLTPDLVCIAGKDGFFRDVNNTVIKKLGYTKEELLQQPISHFIFPEDREITARERVKLLNGQPLINFQNRYVTKQQSILWLDWTSVYFPEKEVVFAIAKEVTERKKLELETEARYRKFKSLAAHFKTHVEKDRRSFAVELHEELAQLAAVVKMDISAIKEMGPDLTAAAQNRLDHALSVSALLIQSIRRISFSVSPYTLHDPGFNETLQLLCNDFTKLHHIPCSLDTNYTSGILTPEIELDFFRICQEALNNILAHAGATAVTICISETNDHILLCIKDDGKGFDPYACLQSAGIVNMRERAASVNGELSIESIIGQGTSICVTIMKQPAHDSHGPAFHPHLAAHI